MSLLNEVFAGKKLQELADIAVGGCFFVVCVDDRFFVEIGNVQVSDISGLKAFGIMPLNANANAGLDKFFVVFHIIAQYADIRCKACAVAGVNQYFMDITALA